MLYLPCIALDNCFFLTSPSSEIWSDPVGSIFPPLPQSRGSAPDALMQHKHILRAFRRLSTAPSSAEKQPPSVHKQIAPAFQN